MQLCKWTLLRNGLSRSCYIGDIKGKTNRGKQCLSEHCRNCFSQMPFDGYPPLLWICKALAPVIFTLPSDISDICFWFDLKKVWKYCRLLHFPIGKYFCERYKQIQLCSLLWSPQLGIEEKIKLDDFFQILSLTLALSPSRPKSIWRRGGIMTWLGVALAHFPPNTTSWNFARNLPWKYTDIESAANKSKTWTFNVEKEDCLGSCKTSCQISLINSVATDIAAEYRIRFLLLTMRC